MQLELTIEEVTALKQIQRNVSGTDYIKVTSILMLYYNFSLKEISNSLGIDISTIYRYADRYRASGVSGLTENKYKGYRGLLSSEQLSQLCTELKNHIYTDAKSVAAWIKNTFDVTYTPQGVVDLLNRIGFAYKKVPCEYDIEKQQIFMEESSKVLESVDEKTVNGVHPTHNSHSTYAWKEKGKELKQSTVSG